MNLRTRIILVALLAATAAAVASFSAGRTMQQDAEARYSAAILSGKQTLWDAIATTQANQLALVAQGVGTDAGIASALRAGDTAALAVAAQSAFELLSDEIFTELTLVDVDGQVVFPAASAATRTHHPLLLQALAEGNLVRGLAPTDAGGFGAGAALPLFEGGKLVGAALAGSDLHTAIAEFARSDGSRVFLASADGRLLHGTEPPLYERLPLHALSADAAARMATVSVDASSFTLTAHPFKDAKGKPQAWLFTATDATVHLANQRRTQNIAYGGTALGLLLALGTLLEYSRRAFHPLVELTASVERLGAGETGVRVRTRAHDEIGTLGRSFNIMAERIEQSIEQERQLTEQLRERVERLLEAVAAAANGDLTADVAVFHDQDAITALANGVRAMLASLTALVQRIQSSATTLTTGSTQIAAAAREQESAVTEQAATTSHIRATVAGITTTAQTLLRTMTETKLLALKTANSANAGRGSLVMMEEATQGMLEATDMIGSKLDVLSAKAAGITSVVTTITSVAAQANLLSLNAVIEAEKAGEFGMGFSVVANEIRRLADQTAVASWDIERMIREMLAAVSGSVTAVGTFTKQIHVNVDRMHEINGRLQEVVQQVDTLLPRFEETHTAMEQQTEGAQQIDEAMEQLNVLARHSADAVRATSSIAQTLNDAAHGLHQETSRFTVAK